MDLCVFDWMALSPIITACIASVTAIYIARMWRGQKRSEVVADEAKHLHSDILQVKNIIAYLGRVSHESDWIEVQGEISDLNNLINRISMRNNFFQIALGRKGEVKAVIEFEHYVFSIFDNALKDYVDTAINETQINANSLLVDYFHTNKKHEKEVFNDLINSSLSEISLLVAYRF